MVLKSEFIKDGICAFILAISSVRQSRVEPHDHMIDAVGGESVTWSNVKKSMRWIRRRLCGSIDPIDHITNSLETLP